MAGLLVTMITDDKKNYRTAFFIVKAWLIIATEWLSFFFSNWI